MPAEKFSNHKVLYADDDPDDLMLVQEAFTKYATNVEVILKKSGFEAINYLFSLSNVETIPCLIILDINMPGMNGKEALRKIREHERFSNVPAVLFSTSSFFADRDFAEENGAGFITKPLNQAQMERIAEEFINHCSDEVKMRISRRIHGL